MKGLNPSKAANIDDLSGKFLKDGTDILARPISRLCNLSVKLNSFAKSCKIAEVKPLFKTLKFDFSPSYQKLLKGIFITRHKIF